MGESRMNEEPPKDHRNLPAEDAESASQASKLSPPPDADSGISASEGSPVEPISGNNAPPPEQPVAARTAGIPSESDGDIASEAIGTDRTTASHVAANQVSQPEIVRGTETVEAHNQEILAESRRHTRRSFVIVAGAAAVAYSFYNWIDGRRTAEMQPQAFRNAFRANAALSRAVLDERGLAPTYPSSKAEDLRVNGVYGLKMALVPESYRLQVVGVLNAHLHARYSQDVTAWLYQYEEAKTHEDPGHDTKTPPPSASTASKMPPAELVEQEKAKEASSHRLRRGREEAGHSQSTLAPGTPGLLLTMEDILKLPKYELVTQFKCIEGWSQIVHWGGIRMVDFLEEYPPQKIDGKDPRFVYMETPDGDYYTGYDMDICRHPQTLLVTEMMGAPLTQYHGAPLRLHMPTKYGYKQIKRIGLISYTNEKPDDYWTKLGYDWYAGL